MQEASRQGNAGTREGRGGEGSSFCSRWSLLARLITHRASHRASLHGCTGQDRAPICDCHAGACMQELLDRHLTCKATRRNAYQRNLPLNACKVTRCCTYAASEHSTDKLSCTGVIRAVCTQLNRVSTGIGLFGAS